MCTAQYEGLPQLRTRHTPRAQRSRPSSVSNRIRREQHGSYCKPQLQLNQQGVIYALTSITALVVVRSCIETLLAILRNMFWIVLGTRLVWIVWLKAERSARSGMITWISQTMVQGNRQASSSFPDLLSATTQMCTSRKPLYQGPASVLLSYVLHVTYTVIRALDTYSCSQYCTRMDPNLLNPAGLTHGPFLQRSHSEEETTSQYPQPVQHQEQSPDRSKPTSGRTLTAMSTGQ